MVGNISLQEFMNSVGEERKGENVDSNCLQVPVCANVLDVSICFSSKHIRIPET